MGNGNVKGPESCESNIRHIGGVRVWRRGMLKVKDVVR